MKKTHNLKSVKSVTLAGIVSLFSTASLLAGSHTVQSGETLWSLSQKYKVSIDALQKANKLPNNNIKLGQLLVIPDGKKTPSKASTNSSKPQKKTATQHTVVKGDNLWKISRKYKVPVATLKQNNGLKNSVINIGQVLDVSNTQKKVVKPSIAKKAEQQKEVATTSNNADKSNPYAVPGMDSSKPVPTKAEPYTEGEENNAQKKAKNPAMQPLPTPSSSVNSEAKKTEVMTEAKAEDQKKAEPKAGLAALSEKQQTIVRQQILLDRNGMGPGIIDGYTGSFTTTSVVLSTTHRPNALAEEVELLRQVKVPAQAHTYINATLPGSGKKPDFKAATKSQCQLMYKTPIEMLSERYHCSEKLLAKINPNVDFSDLVIGTQLLVPNVAEFRIEDFMTPAGKAVSYRYVRKTKRATRIDVDYGMKRMMIWHNSGKEGANDELLASFPVTTNIKKGPKNQRVIESISPAPLYFRKKTGLDLKSGPNSPVGIVWAKLGSGFGIHGTSDGSGNGYNTSSGCIRLSNWDMAIFVKIVPSKVKVNFLMNGVALNKAKSENLAKR